MFYIRERATGFLLRGIGSGNGYYGGRIPIWGPSRECDSAKRFLSKEKAYRFIAKYGLREVDVVDMALRKAKAKENVEMKGAIV